MDKYINQQTLQNALERKQCGPANKRYTEGWNDCLMRVKSMVSAAPIIDAVPVVRCKDCEHAERYERADGTAGYYCGHPQNTFTYGERWDRVFKPAKKADDFCSYGERREG